MSKRKMQSAADRCVELEAEIERLRAVVSAATTLLKEGMYNSALAALEDDDECK